MDRLAGAELEVGLAQFVLDGFIILPDPAAQPVQVDDPRHVGGRQWAVLAGHDRRRHGGGVIPRRLTLRTAGTKVKVTTAGRPEAVGV
ncbi:hypothetical protein [Streptomyces sp. NPDC002520]